MTSADAVYKEILEGALCGEPVEARSARCRLLGYAEVAFRSFPLVCLRRTAWRTALRELEWFLSGSTALADAHPQVRPWWAPWGDGVGYGRFARQLHEGAFSVWDPSGPLPPCTYTGFVACVHRGELCCDMYQRSCDAVCGLPHDWAQLWAYCKWLAMLREVPLGEVRWRSPNVHLYEAHLPLACAVVAQEPQRSPGLVHHPSGDAFKADDFELNGPYCPRLNTTAELVA
jgi:thymidylate synthase